MIFIGIDPGKLGGYASIRVYNDRTDIQAFSWDDDGFVEEMKKLRDLSDGDEKIVACLEKVGPMPKQGVVSMFNFGKASGFIEGVLWAYDIGYQLIPPKKWKSEFGLDASKQKSIEVCQRLFPKISLKRTERCKVLSDGIAEALLMAEYARRKL